MNAKKEFNAFLKPGQIMYSVERTGVGNTMLRTTSVFLVKIIEVSADSFTASWNGNKARTYYRIPSTWKRKKPYIVEGRLTSRKAHREEIRNGHCIERLCYIAVTSV